MTSNDNHSRGEQYGRRNHSDGNTSDDSLLLMADDGEDRTPLLNDTNTALALGEDNLSNVLLTSHCHVPDDKFDYGSRNRLILVLIICILFMCIEIAGMFLD
jgi:hypothetical protein